MTTVGRRLAPAATQNPQGFVSFRGPQGAEGSVSLFFWITDPSTPLRSAQDDRIGGKHEKAVNSYMVANYLLHLLHDCCARHELVHGLL